MSKVTNPFLVAHVSYFNLTLQGLRLIYKYQGKACSAHFDAKSTADMMHRLGMIEGYDIYTNGEPVILFEKECEDGDGNWQTTTGHCLWCEFVKSYELKDYEAELLAELNESSKALTCFVHVLKSIGVPVYQIA